MPESKTDTSVSFLEELDARQDDVLSQLDELNRQIETLLESFTGREEEETKKAA